MEIRTEVAQFPFWEYINSNFFAVYGTILTVGLLHDNDLCMDCCTTLLGWSMALTYGLSQTVADCRRTLIFGLLHDTNRWTVA